jgi:FlgD Ig-like domain/Copper type II ascorbate-dependent monooxygenase, C-terminal domain
MKKINSLLLLLVLIASTAKAQVYKDVAPILIANCTGCHHPGGSMFSLTKYSEVVANAGAIKADVQSGRMPPWPPDANYRKYTHERIVSIADKNKLVAWINAGSPAGDTTLAPPIPIYKRQELNGTPDLVIKAPKFTSTSTNQDQYICLNVPSGLLQDRMVRAYEFIPGNPAIIHHSVISLDTTGTAVNDLSGSCYNFQGQVVLGEFAPGTGPTVFPGVAPMKLGMRMKAGSTVSFQLHIPEGTAGEEDSSELHIYFYPLAETNIRPMIFETVLQDWNFYIPPNTVVDAHTFYPQDQSGNPMPVPINVSLYAVLGHSHNTCTKITNYAFNAADTIPLLKIPNWDFHWQGIYTYPKMVKLPIGYTMYAEHRFDNTINNPLTPNHDSAVVPGLFTKEEMLFDSYIYTYYLPGDENVDIASILANDPLFAPTSISKQDFTLNQIKVYPNPTKGLVNIDYSLLSAQYVQIEIYNSLGQLINTVFSKIEPSGKHTHVWDGTDKSGRSALAGSYIYKIQAGQKAMSGLIIVE